MGYNYFLDMRPLFYTNTEVFLSSMQEKPNVESGQTL